jgi:hypothetical protein
VSVNRYGVIAQRHWARWLPRQHAAISDPETFFTALGEEVARQINDLTDDLASEIRQSDSYLAHVGRLLAAHAIAEELILPQRVLPQPELAADDGQEDAQPERGKRPVVVDRGHPSWAEVDAEQQERASDPEPGEPGSPPRTDAPADHRWPPGAFRWPPIPDVGSLIYRRVHSKEITESSPVILNNCRTRRCGERMTTGQPGGRTLRIRTKPPRPDESMKLTRARSITSRRGFLVARCPRCSDKTPTVSMSISPRTVAMATPASQRSSMVGPR